MIDCIELLRLVGFASSIMEAECMTMTPKQFEDRVFKVEGFKVLVRAGLKVKFDDYPFKRRLNGERTIEAWYKLRCDKIFEESQTVVVIVDGNGRSHMHKGIKLKNLRATFQKKV